MTCNICGARVDPATTAKWVDGYELVQCRSCGVLFRRRLPVPTDLPDLYGASYFRDDEAETGGYADYLADEELHRSLARRRLDRLERSFARSGRLLDVGAAAGFFVAEARERGWDASGIDVSPAMVGYAAETLGVPVTLARLEEVGERELDVVTMWDYIEHSLDPAADVERSASLLRRGGILALSTGDVGSLVARMSRSHWHLLTPRHHNFFFDTKSIRQLLVSHGFDVVDVSHPGARYSISHIVHKLGALGPRGFRRRLTQRLSHSRLAGITLPINLFDIMTVVARRV